MSAAEEYEAALARMKKLEREQEDLSREIVNTYGSEKGLGEEAKAERDKTTGKANVLKRRNTNLSKDLRQAAKDLAKAKDLADREEHELKVKNRPCDRCGRLPDGPMCKACGPANDYKQFVEKPCLDEKKVIEDRAERKPFWCGGPLDTVNGMPWHAAVAECLPGQRMVLLPGSYEWNGRSAELHEQLDLLIDGTAPWAPGEVITFVQKGQEAKTEAEPSGHPTYGELLDHYKDLCREIEGLGCSYGNPTPEEKKLKKQRLEMRKLLRSMAPLKTCWFCSGFSINNYDMPCRDGALGRGDVPREACDCWAVWTGAGGIDDKCMVAWPEFKAMEESEKVCDHGVPLDEDCPQCDENHPENKELRQQSNVDQLSKDLNQAYIDDHPDVKAKVEEAKKKTAVQVMEENAQRAEASRSTSIVISDQGVSIDGGAPMPKEVVSAAIDVINGRKTKAVQQDLEGRALKLPAGVTESKVVSRKRVYEDGFYKISISEDDLLEFNGKWIENKRKIVGAKLRVNPTDDDDFDPDELPEEIERMIKVLNVASINLQSELLTRGRC